ncbi:PilZ domain-containing protein [Methylosarcina fibrata]|uniref:PilZ domain-containing protein n=1 Tax=Methylosarcina fibrata TaxID=105972 RepID=UPI0004763B07|nr:PilZ domain-containing protein [Methylosarcina fibrata]
MLHCDEKRNYGRMHLDCDITFKLADSAEVYRGHCKSISGAGVSFIADRAIDQGKALEINVISKYSTVPSIIAFIEVLRITRQPDNHYEIAAIIKSIKGN